LPILIKKLLGRNHDVQLSSDLSFEHVWSQLNRVKKILSSEVFHFVAIREHNDKEEGIKEKTKTSESSHQEDKFIIQYKSGDLM
jgi:hypothetical protein